VREQNAVHHQHSRSTRLAAPARRIGSGNADRADQLCSPAPAPQVELAIELGPDLRPVRAAISIDMTARDVQVHGRSTGQGNGYRERVASWQGGGGRRAKHTGMGRGLLWVAAACILALL
jgi:hypothetical protein